LYEVAPFEPVQLSDTEALPAVAVSAVGAEGALLAPEELELLLDEEELEELEEELLELEELEDEELELLELDELELLDEEPPEPIWTTASVLFMVLT
jgi:hypothetical protein